MSAYMRDWMRFRRIKPVPEKIMKLEKEGKVHGELRTDEEGPKLHFGQYMPKPGRAFLQLKGFAYSVPLKELVKKTGDILPERAGLHIDNGRTTAWKTAGGGLRLRRNLRNEWAEPSAEFSYEEYHRMKEYVQQTEPRKGAMRALLTYARTLW